MFLKKKSSPVSLMWDIYSVYTTHIVFKSSTKEALLGYMSKSRYTAGPLSRVSKSVAHTNAPQHYTLASGDRR